MVWNLFFKRFEEENQKYHDNLASLGMYVDSLLSARISGNSFLSAGISVDSLLSAWTCEDFFPGNTSLRRLRIFNAFRIRSSTLRSIHKFHKSYSLAS
jgi:hypothetical protein